MLLDQSRSMAGPFGGDANLFGSGDENRAQTQTRKCDFVADVVNHVLHDLVIRCTKTEEIRNYYHIGVIGYSERGVQSALAGAPAGRWLVPIAELAEYPARLEMRYKRTPDGEGGYVEQPARFPVWVEALAEGGTPMCAAFARAKQIVEHWCAEHAESFPPTVLHLADGESSAATRAASRRN